MASSLVPQVFWFRVALPCRKVEGIPRTGGKGRLLDLPDNCLLPEFAPLEGKEPWAHVRAAWNAKGLALSFEVTGKVGPIKHEPDRPFASDGVQIWVDTRDTRNVHRATRFCHRFTAVLVPSGSALGVEVSQRTIHRAQADAPICKPEQVAARAERLKKGWLLELFLPAEVLHGFEPDTNRRLGFAYQVTDPDREDQFLTVGREFPVGEDPSLWATLELQDDA